MTVNVKAGIAFLLTFSFVYILIEFVLLELIGLKSRSGNELVKEVASEERLEQVVNLVYAGTACLFPEDIGPFIVNE